MRNRIAQAVCALALALLPSTVHLRASGDVVYTTIDFEIPGQKAVVTTASAINGDGVIVGWYCLQLPCNAAHTRGFQLKDGAFTLIDVPTADQPGAIGTQPRYISPQGVVIGAYFTLEDGATTGNPRFRGFAWFDGQFTYFDAPDWLYDNPGTPHSIIPRAINAEGDLVGCVHDKDQGDSMHGFVLHDGVFTRNPDGMTMNNGINERGDIVGLDGNSTGYHIDRFGNLERLVIPGAEAGDFVNAWDINASGEIVGQAVMNGGKVAHALLRTRSGDYRFVDPDGALSAVAFGINAAGTIVGQYRDSNTDCALHACVHGFVRQRGVAPSH
jgi:uncharacterized membrane protein